MLSIVFRPFQQYIVRLLTFGVAACAILFSIAGPALAGNYINITPAQLRPGESITISITAPNAAGSWRCIEAPGYSCNDPSVWRQLPASGTETVGPLAIAANTPPGPITYKLHLFADKDVNTELTTYQESATVTILTSNVTPPTTTTPIPSDLVCPLGLVKDGPTGLCLPTNPLTPAAGSIVASSSVGQLIQRFLDILLTLAGVIAILFIVIGGYQYITSRGAEDQAKAGRKTMTYAIIGLIAVLLAYTGVNLVVRLITTGTLFG
ncbi:MAG: hypothetical protein JNK33_05155 [Candidatus Doudnabacteria bacterium]|nr:hypothetical protein [Candidatus Doudnabacteria bacterium]